MHWVYERQTGWIVFFSVFPLMKGTMGDRFIKGGSVFSSFRQSSLCQSQVWLIIVNHLIKVFRPFHNSSMSMNDGNAFEQ